ncbi:hypothetical protein [Engelhardtia mirabilis]
MNTHRLQYLRLPLAVALSAGIAISQGQTTRVSVDSSGLEGAGSSNHPSISGDGRYVAFQTNANLDPSDTTPGQFYLDVYLHDRLTGSTKVVSRDSGGGNPDKSCEEAAISDNGRYIVYATYATDIIPGDDNNRRDIVRYDRLTGTTALVSAALDGTVGDWDSYEPDISADGNVVVFLSHASDLTLQDPVQWAVFARDMTTGVTELVTKGVGGVNPNSDSRQPTVSANGRYVVYACHASNIVPGDNNGWQDIFLYDRQTGATELISISTFGLQANSDCWDPTVSADGRYVAFDSYSSSLVPGDTNILPDVFLRDRVTGQTTRVSQGYDGSAANGRSTTASLSDDGRYVAFHSWASNLIGPPAGPNYLDVFVLDRVTGEVEQVTVSSTAVLANNHSYDPEISADGKFVTYDSSATNLVTDDFNGFYDVFVHDYAFAVPQPDVKINGSDVALTVPAGTPLNVTLGLDAGSLFGQNADWWVLAETPFGNFWLLPTLTWVPSFAPQLLLQFPLIDFAGVGVLNGAVLPAGTYTIHFYVDNDADGVFDGTWSDSVAVTVQ